MRPRRRGLGDAVFDVVRERLGFGVGLVALVAGQFVNLLTLAAEIGGVAIVLQLLSGLSYRALLVLAVLALGARALADAVRVDRARLRLLGLALLVFAVAAIKLNPDWGSVAHGFVPSTGRATAGSTPTTSSAWSGRR